VFNILAPGVVEDHWTAGFSTNVGKSSSLDFSFMWAPETEVSGGNPLAATPGGDTQEVTIRMEQFEIGANYTWRY
jgi:long-chain fatty acid transport protein